MPIGTDTLREMLTKDRTSPPRPTVPVVTNPDLQYLLTLNDELTYMTWKDRPRPNIRDNGGPDQIPSMNYANVKMTESELERVLDITQKNDLPIIPANVCMGFEVGYTILFPASQPLPPYDTLLTFNERQMPTRDWKQVWNVVTRPRNLELLTFYNLGEVKDHTSYEY